MNVQRYSTFLTSATDGGWLSNRRIALLDRIGIHVKVR